MLCAAVYAQNHSSVLTHALQTVTVDVLVTVSVGVTFTDVNRLFPNGSQVLTSGCSLTPEYHNPMILSSFNLAQSSHKVSSSVFVFISPLCNSRSSIPQRCLIHGRLLIISCPSVLVHRANLYVLRLCVYVCITKIEKLMCLL